MEISKKNIYCKDDFKIFVANPIKVEEFRQSWLKTFNDGNALADVDAVAETAAQQPATTIVQLPPIAEELEKELKDVCSENTLTCANESANYVYATRRLEKTSLDVPKGVNLVTLRLQREEIARRWSNTRSCKRLIRSDYERPLKSDEGHVENVDRTDVVLTVTICEPSSSYIKKCLRVGGLKYQVLGSQKLTELRDIISCTADHMVPGDFSENPNVVQETKAKDLYKSGFFFINNIFYNDTREPSCRDYSKVIIDWASADPSRQLGPFAKRKMEETVFSDLEIQLGYPYLYTHQGDCEHLVIFNDLGMVNPDGCMDRSKYPLHANIKRKRGKRCMLCHARTPRWLTRNNDRLPFDPFFFCEICFRSFNYDKNGKKIGNFVAHPYIDRTALL